MPSDSEVRGSDVVIVRSLRIWTGERRWSACDGHATRGSAEYVLWASACHWDSEKSADVPQPETMKPQLPDPEQR